MFRSLAFARLIQIEIYFSNLNLLLKISSKVMVSSLKMLEIILASSSDALFSKAVLITFKMLQNKSNSSLYLLYKLFHLFKKSIFSNSVVFNKCLSLLVVVKINNVSIKRRIHIKVQNRK